jgi:hypothetical protein
MTPESGCARGQLMVDFGDRDDDNDDDNIK